MSDRWCFSKTLNFRVLSTAVICDFAFECIFYSLNLHFYRNIFLILHCEFKISQKSLKTDSKVSFSSSKFKKMSQHTKVFQSRLNSNHRLKSTFNKFFSSSLTRIFLSTTHCVASETANDMVVEVRKCVKHSQLCMKHKLSRY